MAVILSVSVYIVFIIGISYYLSRKNTDEDFLIAGRNRGSLQILFSKFAGSVGMAWFLVLTGYAYQFGFSSVAFLPGVVVSFLLFALWAAPRVHKYSREHSFYTQGDFVCHKTGSVRAKQITDSVSILMQLFGVLVTFIGGAKVFEYLGLFSYETGLIITAAVVLVYILASGFRAVIVTDIVQSIIILVFSTGLVAVLFNTTTFAAITNVTTGAIDTTTLLAFFVYGLFSVFGSSERYQLCFAARGKKELRRGLSWVLVPIATVTVFLLLIGIYMFGQNGNLDPDVVFLVFLDNILPRSLLPIGAILIFAGLMSSADTAIYTATSYVTFLKERLNKVTFLRITSVIVVVLEIIVALIFRDIVGATIVAAGALLTTATAMLYIIAGGTSYRKFIASTFCGVSALIVGIVIFGVVPTIILFPMVGGVLGLLWKR